MCMVRVRGTGTWRMGSRAVKYGIDLLIGLFARRVITIQRSTICITTPSNMVGQPHLMSGVRAACIGTASFWVVSGCGISGLATLSVIMDVAGMIWDQRNEITRPPWTVHEVA